MSKLACNTSLYYFLFFVFWDRCLKKCPQTCTVLGMKRVHVHSAPFCLGVSGVCVRITCRYRRLLWASVTLHLIFSGLGALTGLDAPLHSSFLHHPPLFSTLCFFCHSFPLRNGTNAVLGMAWHHLAHFVSSSFYVKPKKELDLFINFCISFWNIWKNIGITWNAGLLLSLSLAASKKRSAIDSTVLHTHEHTPGHRCVTQSLTSREGIEKFPEK